MANKSAINSALVKTDDNVNLKNCATEAPENIDKDNCKLKTAENIEKITALQEALYAEHKSSLLVVLQAIDGGGKDGTIENIFGPLNSAGCRVASFKVPTPIEADHDFLWRVHQQTPAKGEIVVFNRSHYEQVLVVRVHGFEPKEINETRYEQIKDFERLISSNNTKIVKFFLHISKQEQLERFGARLEDESKHWKLSAGDYKERELWDEYESAFEDMLNRTSTKDAPWFIIPANDKWYRDYLVSEILLDALESLDIKPPKTEEDIEEIKRLFAAEMAKGKG